MYNAKFIIFHSIFVSEEKAFLKDWYSIYKTCYLRAHCDHPAICIDLGLSSLFRIRPPFLCNIILYFLIFLI